MSFIGNVKILGTMKKFPAGAMVIPLLIGCTINTFFPDLLTIGGFTSGLFKNGIPTLIGLYLFCSGATIDVKAAGSTVYKGVVLTALKFFVGFGLGLLLNAIFGEAGFIGLLLSQSSVPLQTQMVLFMQHWPVNTEMNLMSELPQFLL